jgi:hypothetical protein
MITVYVLCCLVCLLQAGQRSDVRSRSHKHIHSFAVAYTKLHAVGTNGYTWHQPVCSLGNLANSRWLCYVFRWIVTMDSENVGQGSIPIFILSWYYLNYLSGNNGGSFLEPYQRGVVCPIFKLQAWIRPVLIHRHMRSYVLPIGAKAA